MSKVQIEYSGQCQMHTGQALRLEAVEEALKVSHADLTHVKALLALLLTAIIAKGFI